MITLLMKWLAGPQHLILVHILRFWLVFLVGIVAGSWMLRDYRLPLAASSEGDEQGGTEKTSKAENGFDYVLTVLMALFVCFFVFVIYYREDFACFDCDQLTDFAVVGHRFPPIWPSEGRFFPLGFQEFNLLRHVTRTPFGFQSVAAAQLVILAGVLLSVLKECRMAWRALIAVAVIVTPTLVISFTGLIYPERNALFWLTILILCLQRANSKITSIYFLACFVATHFLLYYKEPLVVLVIGYAASRMLLAVYSNRRAEQGSWREFLRRNIVTVGLLVVAAIYSILFLVFMFPFPFRPSSYIRNQLDVQHLDKVAALPAFLRTDWVVSLLAVVLLLRVARFVLAGQALEPMWDSLAIAAMAYFAAILGVGIYADYYLAPVDLIAVLYLGRLAALWVPPRFSWRTAIVGMAYVCLVAHNAASSTLKILERKERILSESELAGFLKNYNAQSGRERIEVFFPKTNGFRLAEISSYLLYKGIRLARREGMLDGASPEFVVAGTGNYPSGICHDDKPYLCKHENEPEEGGLIVLLPGDVVRKSDLEQTAKDTVPLVSVASWPEDSLTGRGLRLVYVLSAEDEYHYPQPWWQFYIFKKATTGIENRPASETRDSGVDRSPDKP